MKTVTGFALISTAPNKERHVLDSLRGMGFVKESHLLAGEYDIISKIESREIHDIGSVVVNKIRRIDGVIHTKTLCSFNLDA